MDRPAEKKTDRRVLYTKMFLKESLLELMKEKPIDKITPTELCRRANINRNTFYAHYYTPHDVLAEIEEELATKLIESLDLEFEGVADVSSPQNISKMLRRICRLIYEQKDFCTILLSENGDAAFFDSIIVRGRPIIIEGWRMQGLQLPDDKMDMFFSFIISGSIALMRKWAATDMKTPPDEVAALIETSVYGGIRGITEAEEN